MESHSYVTDGAYLTRTFTSTKDSFGVILSDEGGTQTAVAADWYDGRLQYLFYGNHLEENSEEEPSVRILVLPSGRISRIIINRNLMDTTARVVISERDDCYAARSAWSRAWQEHNSEIYRREQEASAVVELP